MNTERPDAPCRPAELALIRGAGKIHVEICACIYMYKDVYL